MFLMQLLPWARFVLNELVPELRSCAPVQGTCRNGVSTILHRINSMWLSTAIWWHRYVSILAQVMTCCLMAPSHYLNQCCLLNSEVLWHSPGRNLMRVPKLLLCEMNLKTMLLKSLPHLPVAKELTRILSSTVGYPPCIVTNSCTHKYQCHKLTHYPIEDEKHL